MTPCHDCRFWQPRRDSAAVVDPGGAVIGLGECRRYAPHAFRNDGGFTRCGWPTTRADDSCGEGLGRAT